jgi:hypothetical protein
MFEEYFDGKEKFTYPKKKKPRGRRIDFVRKENNSKNSCRHLCDRLVVQLINL